MEPRIPEMRDMLPPDVLTALEARDGASAAAYLERLKSEDSAVAVWGEALGTRLQIRDFLLRQKEDLAALEPNPSPEQSPEQSSDVTQSVTGFLGNLDIRLRTLTGFRGDDAAPATREELRSQRIDRLLQEPEPRMLEIVRGFSHQSSDKVVAAESLIKRTVSIRDEFVQRLWAAAQTFNEGNTAAARQELALEAEALNQNLDAQISTVLSVEGVL